jgi:acetyl-CoA synthetase (ADP-forming)
MSNGAQTTNHTHTSRHTLSESASKELLAGHGVPFARERIAATADDAVDAAEQLGFPVVVKLNGEGIAHKTERGLVHLNLADGASVAQASRALLDAATRDDGEVNLLVAPMLRATRELIVGLDHDEQFGMTILLGLGGVLAEAIADVTMRLVPIERADAEDMIDELRTAAILGPFRGELPIDRDALVDVLLGLSAAAVGRPDIVAVDVNPLLVVDGKPVAVDALVEVRS